MNTKLSTFSLSGAGFDISGNYLLYPQTLTFPAGNFCGLIGHNGSGKSTLLKLLARVQSATCGVITLNGENIHRLSSQEYARQVAYLPQYFPMTEGLTVRELVSLGRYPWHGALGRFSSKDKLHVADAIELTELGDISNRIVDSLSGGEKQKAWIAMSIAQDSRCLLLDEPTSALDIVHQSEILSIIKKISKEKEITVISVLHDINMAAKYCDHIFALKENTLLVHGTPSKIMNPSTLDEIYGITMGVFEHPLNGKPICYVQ